jgi:hypothetical protein
MQNGQCMGLHPAVFAAQEHTLIAVHSESEEEEFWDAEEDLASERSLDHDESELHLLKKSQMNGREVVLPDQDTRRSVIGTPFWKRALFSVLSSTIQRVAVAFQFIRLHPYQSTTALVPLIFIVIGLIMRRRQRIQQRRFVQ